MFEMDVIECDVVQCLVDCVVDLYGCIDVMLNNVGLMLSLMFECLYVDEWDWMIDVNIKGVLYGIVVVLLYMIWQKGGYIINVLFVVGYKVGLGGVVYVVIKYVVCVLIEGLWQEVKLYNICMIILLLGVVVIELIWIIIDLDVVKGMSQVYQQVILVLVFVCVVEYVMSQFDDVDINEVLFWFMNQVY